MSTSSPRVPILFSIFPHLILFKLSSRFQKTSKKKRRRQCQSKASCLQRRTIGSTIGGRKRRKTDIFAFFACFFSNKLGFGYRRKEKEKEYLIGKKDEKKQQIREVSGEKKEAEKPFLFFYIHSFSYFLTFFLLEYYIDSLELIQTRMNTFLRFALVSMLVLGIIGKRSDSKHETSRFLLSNTQSQSFV